MILSCGWTTYDEEDKIEVVRVKFNDTKHGERSNPIKSL